MSPCYGFKANGFFGNFMIIGLLYSWGNLCLDEKSADHLQKVLAGLRSNS